MGTRLRRANLDLEGEDQEGPDEGAEDLKALALWPRTMAMAVAGVLSPILLAVALVWALLVLAF